MTHTRNLPADAARERLASQPIPRCAAGTDRGSGMKAIDIATLQRERAALVALERVLRPHHGKHLRRLSESTLASIREAIARALAAGASVLPQEVQEYTPGKAPKLTCSDIAERVARVEGQIHALDTLDTLPEHAAYLAAYEALGAAHGQLREAAEAAGVGVVWREVTPQVSFQ